MATFAEFDWTLYEAQQTTNERNLLEYWRMFSREPVCDRAGESDDRKGQRHQAAVHVPRFVKHHADAEDNGLTEDQHRSCDHETFAMGYSQKLRS